MPAKSYSITATRGTSRGLPQKVPYNNRDAPLKPPINDTAAVTFLRALEKHDSTGICSMSCHLRPTDLEAEICRQSSNSGVETSLRAGTSTTGLISRNESVPSLPPSWERNTMK
jgi:hypothetical protein